MTTTSALSARVADLHVRVSVEGDGPPVLLLMGLGGHTEMWRPLRDRLEGFTTIAFDAPGTGTSPRPRRPVSMVELAALARRALDAVGVERAGVVGYSFGGAIAQQMAVQHPRRVDRLVLAATNVGLLSVPTTPARAVELLNRRRYCSAHHFRRVAPSLFGGRVAADPRVLEESFRLREVEPPSRAGYLAQLGAIATWTSLPWLRLIRQPTLVVVGDDDRLVPAANGRLLACGIPRARLEVLRGAGHLFLLDEPDRAAPLLRSFLAPTGRGDGG